MTSTTPTPPTTNSRTESGRPTSRVALRRAAVAALVAIGAIASTGCDNADSRAAREALQQAGIARHVADPEKAAKSVEAKVGSLTPADAVQLAHARSILAGAKLAAVRAKLPELQATEAEVIASLGAVDATVAIAAGAAGDATILAQRDPAGTITEVQKVAANTRGDGNAPLAFSAELTDASGKAVKVEVPSQSVVALRISELNGAITRTTDQIAKMNDELARHNVAAGEAALAAESGKTAEERLAKLQEAMNHRIEAATRSQEIANAQAALDQLKAQLAAAENQKASLDDSVQALDARIATLKASSTAVTTAVADRRKSAAALLTADALDPVDKVTERKPSEVLAKADELRKSILDEYAAVLKAYDEAAAAGATVAKDLAGASDSSIPESAVWQTTIETVSAPRYKLAAASAKLDVAGVHYAHALLLAKQNEIAQSLATLFGAGGLTGSAPQTLNAAETSKALAEAVEAANAAYSEAAALVDAGAGTNASKSTRNASTVLKPYVLYGQSQVAALAERVGVKLSASEGSESKAPTAAELLAAAKAAAKEAVEQNLPVGHLPSEFADVMPKKEAAPEQPGSAATTALTPAAPDAPEVVALKAYLQDVVRKGITDGDLQPIADSIIPPAGMEKEFEPVMSAVGSLQKFREAVIAKFGVEAYQDLMKRKPFSPPGGDASPANGGATAAFSDPEQASQQIDRLLSEAQFFIVSPTEVELRPPASQRQLPPGKRILFKQVDGKWKLDLGGLIGDSERPVLVMLPFVLTPMTGMVSELTTNVEAGKYATIDELEAAMKESAAKLQFGAPGAAPSAGDSPPADAPAAPSGETPPAAP